MSLLLCFASLLREGSLEHKHCDTATIILMTETATEWPVGKERLQRGFGGQRDDSRPREDEAGWCEISPRCSEQHTVENLRIVYCRSFSLTIFSGLQLTRETETSDEDWLTVAAEGDWADRKGMPVFSLSPSEV